MAQTRSLATLVLGGLLTVSCGGPSSPTTPDPVVLPPTPVFQAGTWSGVFEFASCTGPAVLCSRDPEPFVLRLAADGRGVLQLDLAWSLAVAVAIEVSVTPVDGVARVGGRTAVDLSSVSYSVDVQADLTGFDGTLAGAVRYTLDTEDGRAVKEGRVLFANRVLTARPSRFEGTWVGLATQTSCAGDECGPTGRAISVRLLMSQVGGSVTGRYNQLDVTGTANGDQLTLVGRFELSEEACDRNFDGQLCLNDVAISATVDALDRLHGTLTIQTVFDDGARRYSTKRTADLTGIVRWP